MPLPTSPAESDARPITVPRSPALSRGGARGAVRVLERLGAGGHAEVWRAVDASGEVVALKTLRAELRTDPAAIAALRREHDVLSRVQHPRIVRTLGLTEHAGGPALLLEYARNGDLVPLLGTRPQHWLVAAAQVLEGLTHLHSCGFVHGDLKPRNVLFAADDSVRLGDFGSALPIGVPLPRGGSTTPYVAPGVDRVGPEMDGYAFAVLLFELVYGYLPPAGDDLPNGRSPRPPLSPPDAAAERLGSAACAALTAARHAPWGLLAFANVIESAVEASR